jgi:cyclopropane-fatty-acyl-phospholipid synthase
MSSQDSDIGPFSYLPSLVDARPMGALWRGVLRQLSRRWVGGELTIELPSGERMLLSKPALGPVEWPQATVRLHHWRAVRRVLFGGDIGFAEAYADGDWSTPDLTALLVLMDRNDASLAGMRGLAPLRLLARLRHLGRANTRRGSRRNISAHYDLGNEFYAQWLDSDMSYSSAIYRDPAMSLEEAQRAKQARIIELLDLAGGESVLEIGCGWGGLAEAMVRQGADVTGITLSPRQLDHARRRFTGFGDSVTLRLQDYRDVPGSYDRIVSVEMIEAVGEQNWSTYFRCLKDRLKPGGSAVLQAITLDEPRFAAYRSGTDFIQQYIFPGGMLPTKSVMLREAARAGLTLETVETFAAGYERTLAVWSERFDAAWPNIAALGFTERFRRLWSYYLAYCRAGFVTGALDVGFYRLRHQG